MPELLQRKVGIVACSGEELAEGTVTRLAALKVLHDLRPNDTVTICLPLFLAGGEGDRAFARFHPTITVDGCDLRCAARATEMHSGKPAASVVVSELVAQHGLAPPEGRRRLNPAGMEAVKVTADHVARLVDEVLASKGMRKPERQAQALSSKPKTTTCSCGSGIPVTHVVIDGQSVELVALPLILNQFKEASRKPDERLASDLLEAVKIYNAVPSGSEAAYRVAILREYIDFCQQEKPQ